MSLVTTPLASKPLTMRGSWWRRFPPLITSYSRSHTISDASCVAKPVKRRTHTMQSLAASVILHERRSLIRTFSTAVCMYGLSVLLDVL